MRIQIYVKIILVNLFVLAIYCNSSAQEEAARIHRIADVSSGKAKIIKGTTNIVKVQRKKQGSWLNAKRNDNLFFQDLLRLADDARVRLRIKRKRQDAEVVFLPDTLLTVKDKGDYQIREAEKGSGRVAIDILQGKSIITVFKDELKVITRSLVSIVSSASTTRALFNVHPNGTGEIYLDKGTISFPDNPQADSIKVGQVARFSNGRITQIFTPGIAVASAYAAFIKLNNDTIWKRPFWLRPEFLIGSAFAVGVGAAVFRNKQTTIPKC